MATKRKTTKAAKPAGLLAPAAALPAKQVQAVFYKLPAIGGKPGNEPVRDWLRSDELTDDDRRVVGADIQKVEWRHPVGMPLVRPMGGGLYELRSSVSSGNEIRLLFMVHKSELILLHGFIKKSRNTLKADLELAQDRMRDWQKNNPRGGD